MNPFLLTMFVLGPRLFLAAPNKMFLVSSTTEAAATLLYKSASDTLNGKICGVNFNDPEFVGFHTK